MHASLKTLIARFRAAQDQGVAFVVEVLGPTLSVRLPYSGSDWVGICAETGLHNVHTLNGVEVYSHGYGIELIFPDLSIDFDWGDNGEPDGFDAWRLWFFASRNPNTTPCPTYDQVQAWLDEAAMGDELQRDMRLYYSPSHRAAR